MSQDDVIVATADRLFERYCNATDTNRAKDNAWQDGAWDAIEAAGLPLAWIAEDMGGSGASLTDGFAIVRKAGRHAVSLPIAETMTAAWLSAAAGLECHPGRMACGPVRTNDRVMLSDDGVLSGRLRAIPHASNSSAIVLLAGRRSGRCAVVRILTRGLAMTGGRSMAGDPLDAIDLNGTKPHAIADAPDWLDHAALRAFGAVVRSCQMAGALEGILNIAATYANERIAFEKPIGKFQAVQQNLACLAGETAVAIAASSSAADALTSNGTTAFGDDIVLEAASAKIRVGEAATEGARIAHQVLGAIGFTREHILHLYTRRLWAWRDDFGTESEWAVTLGQLVSQAGTEGLWPMLAAR